MSMQSSSLSSQASSGCCAHSSSNAQNNYLDSVRRAADANGDGKVSKSEGQDFFRKADKNGDGKISGEEMLRALLDGNKAQGSQQGGDSAGCGSGQGGGSPAAAGKGGGSPSQGASGCGGGKGGASPAGGGSPSQGASGCGSAGKPNGCGDNDNKLDADGDGNITIEELERFMNASRKQDQAGPMNKAQASSDVNGDGCLSLREFMKSMQACA